MNSLLIEPNENVENRVLIFEAFRITIFKRIRQKSSENDEVSHLCRDTVDEKEKGCNRGFSSTCLNSFFMEILLKSEAHWLAIVSQFKAFKLKLLFPLWDISYKTLHAHMNTMITNFPFLPVAILLFISPPLKPLTSKHPNQIHVNKRNSSMA